MQPNVEISADLHQNIQALMTMFGKSSDLQIRNITMTNIDKKAAILFIDEIVDSNTVQQYILEPLLSIQLPHFKSDEELLSFMESSVIQSKTITRVEDMKLASSELLAGKTIIIVDGISKFLSADTTKWNTRSLSAPTGQRVIKGPNIGFSENRSTNISLIRKIIKNPNLRVTTKQYGTNTNTDVSVMYIENIVDKQVLEKISTRLENIQLDAVLEGNYLEKVLTQEAKTIFPLMLSTDRPDVIAGEILEGKIAIFVDGTPYVLTAPAVLIQFFLSPDDYYGIGSGILNLRLLRIALFFLSVYILGIYVAFMTYHANLLPVKLLVGFVSQRELVPIPTSLEVIFLLIILVAINESSTRLPQSICLTVSIFGAIILGQATVDAQLVQPVSLVVTSLAYIFVSIIPYFPLRFTVASLSFCCVAAGAALGLYGILLFSIVLLLHLCSLRSFGVPYLSPFAPLVPHDLKDSVVRMSLEEVTNDESNFFKEETMEETNQDRH